MAQLIPAMLSRSSFVRAAASSALVLGGLVLSSRAVETGGEARLIPVMLSNHFVVAGEVIARADDGFTVLTRDSQLTQVRVNQDTAITKGAEYIGLAEMMVGDKVRVTVMRIADGTLQAVNVAVRTGYE